MANEQINMRIAPEKLEQIDKKAVEMGLSRTDLILKAVDMLINFDEDFYNRLQKYSKGLKTPEYVVIQNMIIKRMAMFAARTEVWGEASEHLDEFVSFMKNGKMEMITGNELFEFLKKHYAEVESKKKAAREKEIEAWMNPDTRTAEEVLKEDK